MIAKFQSVPSEICRCTYGSSAQFHSRLRRLGYASRPEGNFQLQVPSAQLLTATPCVGLVRAPTPICSPFVFMVLQIHFPPARRALGGQALYFLHPYKRPGVSGSRPLDFSIFRPSSRTSRAFSSGCALFFSLCALFARPVLCFLSLAHSSTKTPGCGGLCSLPRGLSSALAPRSSFQTRFDGPRSKRQSVCRLSGLQYTLRSGRSQRSRTHPTPWINA